VRDDGLHRHLDDLAGRLERVTSVVADLRTERAGQHGELLARVGEAQRVTEALRSTTEGLERVLANPQARGQWGERMCDDVLRAAGLVEGVNYAKQQTLPDGTRPDITFLLPDDRRLHMDVKFPLAGYQRWCTATTDRERTEAANAFLRDVRNRVKELVKPGYADERTVGFVLLFIPNESVYGFIHGHDPALADEALARRVVLCSPFTLFAVLGVIRQAADAIALQRGADEVLDVLAGFTKQWDQFTERLDGLGRGLQTVQNAYEQLNGPRRRQLERQLDKVDAVRQQRGLDGDSEGAEPPILREVSAW
jgi:DNA recombination protein RmuC